jgi:cobalt-zinc-cadmium efflux system protein
VIVFNIVITGAEFAGGIISGSLALVSDAGHNLSDVLSLILGYAGERVSERKPDQEFSFGFKRFEVLVALLNALSLLGIGLYIVYEAVERYTHPVKVIPEIMLPVAVIGLLGNLFSLLVLNRDRASSLNMKAAFLHLFYDALSSLFVIAAGVLLIFTDLYLLDLVISLFIVIMILWSSMDIIRESLRIFLQGTPRGISPDEVRKSILAVNEVGDIHGLHIWSISSTEVFLSCHICVEGPPESVDTDLIIRSVNALLEEKFGIRHTTLQVENTMLCGTGTGVCCR